MTKAHRDSVTAHQIARAALAIARANHYLVGFEPSTTDGLSADDLADAKQILINRENAAAEPRTASARRERHVIDLAFEVLASFTARAKGGR